jgi:DNA-binding transcriptional regulator YhcF (GntR family)
MDFKTDKPIYLQIVDFCFAQITSGKWMPNERIPSTRELAVALVVNPHTALKAYEYLEEEKIIYTKRGLGFFLYDDAIDKVIKSQKEEFFQNTLEDIFNKIDTLNIDIQEIVSLYQRRKGGSK